jgi:formylglycine-generating enzyme required for sulfatase activity
MPPFRLALLLLTLFASFGASAEVRVALVVGNSDYASGPLPNPANDAKLIADTLTSLHFEVIRRIDADQVTMKRAIQEFGAKLEKGGPSAVGLFYYAGHGVQINGRNYLIPVNARIEREGDAEIEAVSADWVLEQMRFARNALNFVILDACRNNPFARSMRGGSSGLAVMDSPTGILIAYSTSPGSVAADGNGRNSPYTEALSKAMLTEHEPVEQIFKHVRVGVMNQTSGKQVPWEASSLTGDFYFSGSAGAAAPPPAAQVRPAPVTPAPQPVTVRPVQPQAAPPSAQTNSPSNSGGGVSGFFSRLFGSDSSNAPANQPSAPAPSQNVLVASVNSNTVDGARAKGVLDLVGIKVNEIDEAKSYPLSNVKQLIETTPRRVSLGSTLPQIDAAFHLCQKYEITEKCRREWFSDEILRAATLEPFELDTGLVTVAAFRQFVSATHYETTAEKDGFDFTGEVGGLRKNEGGNWRTPGPARNPAADDTAVVAVSFDDAQAYCRYRNSRLPTENEWEYVARGGAEHRTFPWGESVALARGMSSGRPKANAGPAGGIGDRYHGLSGNVWQWVDSRYDSTHHVVKGGSFVDANPANRRTTSRGGEEPLYASDDAGFRCARTLKAWPDVDYWMAQLH